MAGAPLGSAPGMGKVNLMSKESEGHAGIVVAAFLLGAVAGAVTALLAAPATGEESRDVLAKRAREGREKANEAAKQGREFVHRQREHLVEAVDRGIEVYKQTNEGNAEPAKDKG